MQLLSLSLLPPKHEHRLLGLLLITLHIALYWGSQLPILMKISTLLHLGLFLIWQPFWSKQDPLETRQWITLGLLAILFLTFLNLWLLTLWQLFLIGILSGRDLAKPRDQIVNHVAILYLIITLFTINLHELFLFPGFLQLLDPTLLKYGLLLIPIPFLLIPTDDTLEYRHQLNLFHSLTFVLFIKVIALGSLTLHHYSQTDYPLALLELLLITLLLILSSSWLWMILIGQEGLDTPWSRDLLNVGSAFETWLEALAQPNHYKNQTPQEFLHAGFSQMSTLPWIAGINWQSPYGKEDLGQSTKQAINITVQSIEVTVYSRYRITSSHHFQIKIFIHLLEHFHQAKRREAAFAKQAHLQAIHETGAKLTHDIKNLLQSLHNISSVIDTHPPEKFGETQRFLQGQMPTLTQRLKRTLDKLQNPVETSFTHIPVNLWWSNLKTRYRKSGIEFFDKMATGNDTLLIPEDLFDNVAENVLQNALNKRNREPKLKIEVTLTIDEKHNLEVTICDDGSAIPQDIYKDLLTTSVKSKDGFGIGLYQAAKQLIDTNYELQVSHNEPQYVCFQLSNIRKKI